MMKQVLLSCRAATALMEKQHRSEITRWQRMQLSMHVALCAACREYRRQSSWIETLLGMEAPFPKDPEQEKQAKALEKKILKRLEEED